MKTDDISHTPSLKMNFRSSLGIEMTPDSAQAALLRLESENQSDASRLALRRTTAERLASSAKSSDRPLRTLLDVISTGPNRRLRYILRRRKLFADEWYRNQHKKVGWDALGHFLRHGFHQNFSPNPFFDPIWYATFHGLGRGPGVPLLHYLDHGSSQALAPGPFFDPVAYLIEYPELGMVPDLLGHYLSVGIREGRPAFPLARV